MIRKSDLRKMIPHYLSADNTVQRDALEAMISLCPHKAGRMIHEHAKTHDYDNEIYKCSYCWHVFKNVYGCEKWNYCPICGAKMVDEVSE